MFAEHKVKNFQFRWKEPLGHSDCPYMYRWVWIFFGYSIRLHHWIRSDDRRFMHNHPWGFLTICLKGGYTDFSLATGHNVFGEYAGGNKDKDRISFGSIRYRPASHSHYVDVPKGGAWTLMFCGRKKQKWGFNVNGVLWRPLRYFSKWSHPPCSDQ